jgi:hypothetical protein
MFQIDPLSYHNKTQLCEDEQGIKNLYAEILKRALEDLRYYKEHTNTDTCIQWDAYSCARSAQHWIDGHIITCAVPAQMVYTILGIEKFHVDQYLDKHGIRFNYDAKIKPKTKRQANEIRRRFTTLR